MKRLAVTLAAALVLTPVATRPAVADGGGELLGLLLGIGTVYAIGKGIERARTPAPAAETVAHLPAEEPGIAPGYRWSMPDRDTRNSSICCLQFAARAIEH